MADVVARDLRVPARSGQLTLHKFARRKSTIAFLMALPLITIVLCLVVYPALYSIHLATLNKSMQHFVGFGNFEFLFRRNTFWMVVEQSLLFAITAVIFKAVVGFIVAHFVHNLPAKGQRKWRGMLLIPWVIPPAMSTLAWLWLFDPSYSAFNWIFAHLGIPQVAWLGNPYWARHSRQYLGRLAFLYDHVSRRSQIGPGAVARGGGDRRSQLAAKDLVHKLADDA